MKLSTLLVFALAILFAGGCGGETASNTENSVTAMPTNTAPPGPSVPAISCTGTPATPNACGNLCVNLLTQPLHCGVCGHTCASTEACVGGVCTGCPGGTTDCNGECKDTDIDVNNCGQCGNSCAGAQCVQGVCQCAGGGQLCGAECVLSTDPRHCGGCNNACSTGSSCDGTGCVCLAGRTDCGALAGCVDVASDGSNCGTCGTDCAATGMVCSAGACSATCAAGTSMCGASCVDTMTNLDHCGGCDTQCPANSQCTAGACTCADANQQLCGGVCTDVQSNVMNCGACGTACAAGESCSAGVCGCPVAGQEACGGACVDVLSSGVNCGSCGVACAAGESCTAGVCMATGVVVACVAGVEEDCNGTCVPLGTCMPGVGGSGNGGAGPVGNGGGGGGPGPTGCDVPGMIADFEGGSLDIVQADGRIGVFDLFNDGAGTQTLTVETEGTEACNTTVLHTTGSNFASYAGIGTVFTGTWDAALEEYIPEVYDGSQYTAISFRAKAGPGQMNPVRMNISVPSTEGPPYGAGNCTDSMMVDNPCWNHIGHFLIDDEQLTNTWQTYTFCFDRDLYPMFLPSHLTVEERNTIAQRLLKIQFQFNQSFDQTTAMQVARTASFDFYLDDVRFTNPASCDGTIFQSTGSATDAFGTNSAVGNCMPVPNAAKFNKAVSQAYARWKAKFVQGDGGVVDPQEAGRVVSEAIGYGMLITAAMGDKATFDSIWGWASSRIGNPPNSLLGWNNGSGGSATDGDTDMAFALLMAGKQWGGNYAAAGNALAALALSGDVAGNVVVGGNQFQNAFNPSYFSPGFYRKFNGWGSVISTTYGVVQQCASQFGGLIPDWCQTNGTPAGASAFGAQQQAGEICAASEPCLAFESARTPWRLGYDVCFDNAGSSVLTGFMNKLKSTDAGLASGSRIDTIVAGWNASGPLATGVGNAMAFLGPLGVAGMALNDAATRDRAFRATLDIMERPEFYNTYYQATVGMLALLTMTGNFPTP